MDATGKQQAQQSIPDVEWRDGDVATVGRENGNTERPNSGKIEARMEPREITLPRRGGQHYEILMYLRKGGRLTVGKALLELNVYALSQRIGELKKQGWPIQSVTVETSGGARVSEYFL